MTGRYEISRDSVQDSLYGLREAADHYEKHATQYSWNELLRARADVEELGSIAAAAHAGKESKTSPTGMEKFCNVALEYSKLLDVVFNESHEYVSIVWGVIKVLLVANINHARLREKVEEHLISIGEQAAIVNHFIFYNPTEKMVESVGLLYADLSQFLKTAIRSYAKSKLGGCKSPSGVNRIIDDHSFFSFSPSGFHISLGDQVPYHR